jgi:hypothetical protein
MISDEKRGDGNECEVLLLAARACCVGRWVLVVVLAVVSAVVLVVWTMGRIDTPKLCSVVSSTGATTVCPLRYYYLTYHTTSNTTGVALLYAITSSVPGFALLYAIISSVPKAIIASVPGATQMVLAAFPAHCHCLAPESRSATLQNMM